MSVTPLIGFSGIILNAAGDQADRRERNKFNWIIDQAIIAGNKLLSQESTTDTQGNFPSGSPPSSELFSRDSF